VTDIIRIVEKFTMTLEGPPPGRDAWFLDYVLRSPNQAGKHLTAGWLALNSLKEVYRGDEIKTCREYFGGMGAQALMCKSLFNLREHWVLEYNRDAVDHLCRVLPRGVNISIAEGDSYNPLNTRAADLVVLDFGDLTAWKTREGEQHRGLLDRVFSLDPKAVVFTDIACRYLHLHRERYESLLGPGTCVSYETYLRALLARLEVLYGYRLVRGYHDRWSTVMALVPEDLVDETTMNILGPTPASPVGLEIF
jgi:hypothetical protein